MDASLSDNYKVHGISHIFHSVMVIFRQFLIHTAVQWVEKLIMCNASLFRR